MLITLHCLSFMVHGELDMMVATHSISIQLYDSNTAIIGSWRPHTLLYIDISMFICLCHYLLFLVLITTWFSLNLWWC